MFDTEAGRDSYGHKAIVSIDAPLAPLPTRSGAPVGGRRTRPVWTISRRLRGRRTHVCLPRRSKRLPYTAYVHELRGNHSWTLLQHLLDEEPGARVESVAEDLLGNGEHVGRACEPELAGQETEVVLVLS